MAYQATESTLSVKQANLENLLKHGHKLVEKGGFQGLSIAKVTAAAGMAAGNLYRYFDDKDALAVAIFKRATEHEIQSIFASVNTMASPALQLDMLLTAFCERALANSKLAYALIAEPVSPALEAARLEYRATWAQRFLHIIEQGIAKNLFLAQPAHLSALAIVGAMAEAVVLKSDLKGDKKTKQYHTIKPLVAFCLRGLGCGENHE